MHRIVLIAEGTFDDGQPFHIQHQFTVQWPQFDGSQLMKDYIKTRWGRSVKTMDQPFLHSFQHIAKYPEREDGAP
jgi:hypothetical protein